MGPQPVTRQCRPLVELHDGIADRRSDPATLAATNSETDMPSAVELCTIHPVAVASSVRLLRDAFEGPCPIGRIPRGNRAVRVRGRLRRTLLPRLKPGMRSMYPRQ